MRYTCGTERFDGQERRPHLSKGRRRLLLVLASAPLLFLGAAIAHRSGPPVGDHEHGAVVTVQREAHASTSTSSGMIVVELSPPNAWRGTIFVSLAKGPFHERKQIRPDEAGRYRLDVRLPEAGEWSIYLRYGLAQAGYEGWGRLELPSAGGMAVAEVPLYSGFSDDVPSYVQPLGFLTFAVIAALTLWGLRVLLQEIRARQPSPVNRNF